MNRVHKIIFRLLIASFACALFAVTTLAQTPSPSPRRHEAAATPENPFAPETAAPLPAGMTGSDANDPRAKLTPGIYDAGEAAMGIKHLLLLKKPDAFQLGSDDPDDPKVQKTLGLLGVGDTSKMPKSAQLVTAQLAFANSDLAFQGNHLFHGKLLWHEHLRHLRLRRKPSLLTSMVCPGGQGDVSVYKNLIFMSVEMPNGRLDCGTQGFPPPPPPARAGQEKNPPPPPAQKDRFRGVRIFDITDIRNPKQVAAVQTCRGSHTHTLVVDPNDKNNVYIYVSGTSFVRQSEELAGCSGETPDKDPNTALFRIDVIKVPLATPQDAAGRLQSAAVYGSADRRHQRSEQRRHARQRGREPKDTDQCHDITVYSAAWARGRRLLRKWNSAGHQRSGQSKAHRRGQRSELCVLALGLVFE